MTPETHGLRRKANYARLAGTGGGLCASPTATTALQESGRVGRAKTPRNSSGLEKDEDEDEDDEDEDDEDEDDEDEDDEDEDDEDDD